MRNTDDFYNKGFLKSANDFFKYLALDYNIYRKKLKDYFQEPPAQLAFAAQNEPQIKEEKTVLKDNLISIHQSVNFKNMSNLRNSVQLIGRLGKSPEVKQLESGRFVANVSIATNDIYKNGKGEKVIETQWHNLVAWGKNAENFQKILSKGDEVAIQGKLTHRSYEDKDGVTRYVSEIVVNEFVKLSSRLQMANVA